MDACLGQACPLKDTGYFLLKTLKAMAACMILLTPLTLVLMVFGPGTVDAEKRLCRSSCASPTPPFSRSLSLLVSPLLTPPSFCSLFVHFSPIPHTYTHLYSPTIRLVIIGQCQHLKTVVLAEPVSSQVELTIFPVPDCKKLNSFQRSYTLHQVPVTEEKPSTHY